MALGNPPPAFVSELAEELAPLAAIMDGRTISRRITEESERHHLRGWELTLAVAREWDRLGIVRVGGQAGPMGV